MVLKNVWNVWIIISGLLLILVLLSLANAYVTIKYEVEEFEMSNILNDVVIAKKQLLSNLTFVLRTFGIYLVINIFLLLYFKIKRE